MKKIFFIVGLFLLLAPSTGRSLGPSGDTPYGVAVNPKTGQCTGLVWGDIYDGNDKPSPSWVFLRYSQVSKLSTAAGTCYLDQENVFPESCCGTLSLRYVPAVTPEPSVVSQPYTVCNNGYCEGENASCCVGESQNVTGNIKQECDYQRHQTLLAINLDEKTCSVGYEKAVYVKQTRYVPGNAESAGGEITGHDNEPADPGQCPALEPAITPTQTYPIDYSVFGMPRVSLMGIAYEGKYCDSENPASCCHSLGYKYISSVADSEKLYSPYILGGLLFLAIGYFILRPRLLLKAK